MRPFDLSAGAAKLEMALRSLQERALEIEESWDDPAYHSFVEGYIAPLDSTVKTALDAIHRLAEILVNAQRQCGEEGSGA
jgi:hypothetical protein